MHRKVLVALVGMLAVAAATASPSQAIVGGTNAAPGEFPSVAKITFGAFGCTGTLIDPTHVLTAGHCGSLTGATGFGVPAAWPTPLINVTIGGHTTSTGERVPVSQATVHPKYLLVDGYDITVLTLSRASTKQPTQVAGPADRGLWTTGTKTTIVGWGATKEGGSSPSTLQKAQVPIVSDADCAKAYRGFETLSQVCAGYPQGGTDTCQGDSGGPMFSGGRVVGATSYGEGCARPNKPGVYARVGDPTLGNWIKSIAPAGVAS